MSHRHPPLEPELEALLSSRKVAPHVPADVRASALARARTIVAARGEAPPRPRVRRFTEAAVPCRGSRFGLVRIPLVASLAVTVAAACAFAALHSRRPNVGPIPAAASPPSHAVLSPVVLPPAVLPPAVLPPAVLVPPVPPSEPEPSPPVASPVLAAQAGRGGGRSHLSQSRPRVDRFEAELALLQPAHVAYEKGDFSAMLRILQEHARAFPRGRLAEEREALRVESLRRLGRRDEAHLVARAFVVRFPQSVFLSHVRDSLP